MIASNTKAMTTLMLARLVDQGKLTWDTPVTDLLPSFRLGNPEKTRLELELTRSLDTEQFERYADHLTKDYALTSSDGRLLSRRRPWLNGARGGPVAA